MEFMHSEFRRVSIELYPKTVTTYPGAKETLLKLKEHGYKLGIVTNKIHSSTLFCLKLIGLEGIFDSLVCYDDVKNPKPHKEPIAKAMDEIADEGECGTEHQHFSLSVFAAFVGLNAMIYGHDDQGQHEY